MKEHITHYTCNKRLQQKGGKAECCYCSKHSHCEFSRKCKIPMKETKPEWEKICYDEFCDKNTGLDGNTYYTFNKFISIEKIIATISKILLSQEIALIKEFVNHKRCLSCGDKKKGRLSDTCAKCFETK